MRSSILCLLLVICLLCGCVDNHTGDGLQGTRKDGELVNDQIQIAGKWKVTVFKWNGVSFEKMIGTEWVFSDGKIKTEEENNSYRIDAVNDPPAIDITNESGGIFRGIYFIHDDKLTICHVLKRDSPRPSKFESVVGSDLALIVLKQSK
jgi:uncharacterized protein (TIGR03067 family)